MERAYAQALWSIVERGGEHKKAVAALHQTLVRTGRERLIGKILAEFKRIAVRESKRSSAVISVGRRADVEAALKAAGVSESEVILDPTLIGGYRIEKGDTLVDASWKNHLITIYNAVTA